MCTVTFIARQRGYGLGMNRDEKLTRPIGLPPEKRDADGCAVLCPSESGGGTWIAVNDRGVTFALINWYSVPTSVSGKAVSRGEVVSALSSSYSPDISESRLGGLSLKQINPFRVMGIFPATGDVIEWSWNLQEMVRKRHPWQTRQWISSGFDESKVQRLRGETFETALGQCSAGSLRWLRQLHRSHSPCAGPFSTCMHRTDAATVSYTEVSVSANEAVMQHHASAPCTLRSPSTLRVKLTQH